MSTQTNESYRGITISVTAETNAGGRRHMEDYIAVNLAPSEAGFKDIGYLREQAYIGVFDGHGGKEAAKCARERLWEVIQKQPKFRSSNLECVKESVIEGFQALHKEMEPQRVHWKKNKMGDLSTAGTTASTVIFRQDHIIVANVGDSTAVLAVLNPQAGQEGQHTVLAKTLTIDHKPEDPKEIARIEKQGGQVMLSRKGVHRVVWQRERKSSPTTALSSTNETTSPIMFDTIPFLSVARSLGDYWSFSPITKEFVVSPFPDVHILPLEPKIQKFLVIASDGLWNVMTPTEVVQFIWDYEHDESTCHQPRDVVKAVINEALRRWKRKNLLADNIAVLIAFLTEEIVTETPNPPLPANTNKEAVTVVTPSPITQTDLPREELIPASNQPSTSSAVIEVHTRSKIKQRSGSTKRYFTTLNSSNEVVASELSHRRRKRVKSDDIDMASSVKRAKTDCIDSGIDVDNLSEPAPLETDRSAEKNIEMEIEDSPLDCCVEIDDEDSSSSGVSFDSSDPGGMPQQDTLKSPPTVVEYSQ